MSAPPPAPLSPSPAAAILGTVARPSFRSRRRPLSAAAAALPVLALLGGGCATQRVESERIDIPLGRPPMAARNQVGDASAATIAQLGRESTLPTDIGANPDQFDYESQVGSLPTTGGGGEHWLDDHAEALRLARRENKPLLIWFSNSTYSPNDREMEDLVFAHERFIRAVNGRVVRVRIDYSRDSAMMRSDYHIRLRTHFGVRGSPFVAVALPDGTEIGEFKGFKAEWTEGYLDNFEVKINEAVDTIDRRQKQLQKEGYRWWTNSAGQALFALPLQYDPESSRLALLGMWGDQWIVQRRELGEADQLFLAQWTTEGVAGRVRETAAAPPPR